MDTEERRAWKLLFEKVNAMNDDPLKRTPACELDRDNKVNAMDDTQRRAAVVRCKKTGEDIAVKLDGGQCACMTAEACCLQEAVLDRISRTTSALMDAAKAERERWAASLERQAEEVLHPRHRGVWGRDSVSDLLKQQAAAIRKGE